LISARISGGREEAAASFHARWTGKLLWDISLEADGDMGLLRQLSNYRVTDLNQKYSSIRLMFSSIAISVFSVFELMEV